MDHYCHSYIKSCFKIIVLYRSLKGPEKRLLLSLSKYLFQCAHGVKITIKNSVFYGSNNLIA